MRNSIHHVNAFASVVDADELLIELFEVTPERLPAQLAGCF
jgi:hypothetical protein